MVQNKQGHVNKTQTNKQKQQKTHKAQQRENIPPKNGEGKGGEGEGTGEGQKTNKRQQVMPIEQQTNNKGEDNKTEEQHQTRQIIKRTRKNLNNTPMTAPNANDEHIQKQHTTQ